MAGNTTAVALTTVTYDVAFGICLLYDEFQEQPNTGTVPLKLFLCDADGNNLSTNKHKLTAVFLDNPSTPPLPNDAGR